MRRCASDRQSVRLHGRRLLVADAEGSVLSAHGNACDRAVGGCSRMLPVLRAVTAHKACYGERKGDVEDGRDGRDP